ncbi:MAG: beta-ketoacyl synthase [Muribaculaceae bacterium]|nr:beta-ketoacyl synthase [Muribaculaceae bacterium]
MIVKIADNIISPLGMSTAANVDAVAHGRSRLELHADAFGLPEPFFGSLLDRAEVDKACAKAGISADYTFFERLCLLSVLSAIEGTDVDPSDSGCVLVLSSTKGNVDTLEADRRDPRAYIATSAARIARRLGNTNTPIVASNACISGVCAQIAAVRALLSGRYHTAIVVGADVLSKFIVSGFQSFKALSPEACKPYDKDRTGLNLGEAAATIVLGLRPEAESGRWQYLASSIHNDANHISGPSRTGEGSYRVLRDILGSIDPDELAFVNAHGTATPYNDEMEAIAINRAGLTGLPLCGLKGYYGHTLGAAGVLETVLSMHALDRGTVPATRGYSAAGTSFPPDVSAEPREAKGSSFIKILSGFGGSNAGIAYGKGGEL